MARSPLAARVRDAASVVAEASERGIDVEQVVEERRTTRRQFIGGAAP